MAGLPLNPDAPTTLFDPGVYLSISTQPVSNPGPQAPNLLLVAPALLPGSCMTGAPYSLSAGTANPNEIVQYTELSRVHSRFHRRSPLAARYRAAIQAQQFGLNIFCAAVPEPSASGFTGVASALLTAGGTAAGSGEIRIFICGHLVRVQVANGDTAATFATNLLTALGGVGGGTNSQIPDCPMVPNGIISNVTVPLAYVTRGADGNDHPIVVYIPPEITGLTLSPGTITITTNAAGKAAGASQFTITCGTQSITVSIPVGTTPTAAATAIASAINQGAIGLTATSALGVVTLLYRSGWVVHRLTVASTEDAGGQVYTLADRQDHGAPPAIATVATVAGNPAATSLQGAGTPTLTTVLSNRAKAGPMLEWAVEYTDSTSMQAIAGHVELYGNGYYQANQHVSFASSLDPVSARALLTTPSPAMSNFWRYSLLSCLDPPMQAGNLAAQVAADLCATTLPFNFDGHIVKSGNISPMYPPRSDVDYDPPTRDVAMRTYLLTPVVGDNGQVQIRRGVTTWGATNREWSDWSYGRMFDDSRFRLRAFLNDRFHGKVLFTETENVRVANGFTLRDVREACIEWLDSRDGITIDGAKLLSKFVQVDVSADDGTTILIALRIKPPREAHKITGVLTS